MSFTWRTDCRNPSRSQIFKLKAGRKPQPETPPTHLCLCGGRGGGCRYLTGSNRRQLPFVSSLSHPVFWLRCGSAAADTRQKLLPIGSLMGNAVSPFVTILCKSKFRWPFTTHRFPPAAVCAQSIRQYTSAPPTHIISSGCEDGCNQKIITYCILNCFFRKLKTKRIVS